MNEQTTKQTNDNIDTVLEKIDAMAVLLTQGKDIREMFQIARWAINTTTAQRALHAAVVLQGSMGNFSVTNKSVQPEDVTVALSVYRHCLYAALSDRFNFLDAEGTSAFRAIENWMNGKGEIHRYYVALNEQLRLTDKIVESNWNILRKE